MNELIRIEEKQLIVAQEVINQICEFENAKKQIEAAEKKLKEKLEEVMSTGECGTSFESSDKRLKITYTPAGKTTKLNQEKLYEKYPEAYRDCYELYDRKGSIRITVREVKENE